MYAVYNYAAGATQANVLSDLVAILTGTTDKTTLSAACVQANTTITSTVAAGWTVYDAAAGSNLQVIRALNQDGSTYKYFRLGLTSTTATSGMLSESWNAGTHTGTNNTAAIASTWDSAGGGYFYIYATAKNIVILPWTATGYKSIVGLMVMEMTRDTIPTSYPCAAILSADNLANTGGVSGAIPKTKNPSSAGDTTPNANLYFGPVMTYSAAQPLISQLFRDAADASYLAVYKVGASVSTGVMLGVGYDIYITGAGTGSNLDEVTYGGVNYVIFFGPAGRPCVLVPKQ